MEWEQREEHDLKDRIKTAKENTLTVNDMFDRYIATKTELKDSTRNNYKYMYEHYIRDSFGQKSLLV